MKFALFLTSVFLVIITVIVVKENIVQIRCVLKREKPACIINKTERKLTSLMWVYIFGINVVTATLRATTEGTNPITAVFGGIKSLFQMLFCSPVGLVFALYIELLCWQFYIERKKHDEQDLDSVNTD